MKKLLLAFSALGLCFAAEAQNAVNYTFTFPNLVHHEAEVSMVIPQLPAGPVKVRMSRSSPGRYATHEFGKNVYNVKAFDAKGKPLAINQLAGDVYEIPQHGSEIKITYTLFGNWTDGTYVSIDESHAHLNMPGSLMWTIGMDNRPIRISFPDVKKHGWRVATQLKSEGNNTYFGPGLQYVMDSPTELSDYKETSWEVTNTDGKKEPIHLTIHSDDSQEVIDNFGKMVQRLVLEEKAVYGELPTYDYGSYTFLDDVYPTNSGDGMEHRNSTCIVQTTPRVAGYEKRLLGTFSHEYFHSWNVERIRPKTLEPFNFEHANMSNELWFAEGFTQYYGDLLLTRAGFNTDEDFYDDAAGLINSVLNTPGARDFSAVQASRYAVYADAGVAIDATNKANIFNSYYVYGGAIALALDLHLRTEFKLTLDDYMRAVWLAHGKVEKAYTIPDLQNILAKLTGNPSFAANFYKKYVYGLDKNDYAALLDKAGLVLRRWHPGKAWVGRIGAQAFRGSEGAARGNNAEGVLIASAIAKYTPAYKAGLDAGDIITAADGNTVKDYAALTELINSKKPDDKLKIAYKNRTGEHETTLTLEEDPAYEVVTYEKAGKTASDAQLAIRKAWLSTKVK
ncbi:M61 family metallopeptidase [Mucilaginibacter sp. KACC 22063]|uniref:M61 family metallopeptidase n=1 Tax=Mucilaginibacter sp. KACC 22063 TaxID=3025666 RepID=UPI002366DE38|nr:PDZ domain-containing protein [Mucilaginibacter sp. KACC 22063]WDF55213.1 PDZ domain-containing protein [Mucilaginibacter sp. KACC 22063]